MKKWIVIVLAAAAVLAVAVTAVLLITGRSADNDLKSEDCPYEYLVENGSRSVTVTIKGQEEGYLWENETNDQSVFTVSGRSEKNGDTVFTLTPQYDGVDTLKLVLRDKASYSNVIYMIRLHIEVNDGRILATDSSHRRLEGVIRGAGGRYSITPKPDGTFRVGIAAVQAGAWQSIVAKGDVSVTKDGGEETQGTDWFTISPEGTDEMSLLFVVPGSSEVIEIVIGFTEDGYSVLSHELRIEQA